MTSNPKYSEPGTFGYSSYKDSKFALSSLPNGSAAQTKHQSQWAPNKSLWEVANPDKNAPSLRVTSSLLNGPVSSKTLEPQIRLYPTPSPFGVSPWGKKPSLEALTSPGRQHDMEHKTELYQPRQFINSIPRQYLHTQYDTFQPASSNERRIRTNVSNEYTSDISFKSHVPNNNSIDYSSASNRSVGFDERTDHQRAGILSPDIKPIPNHHGFYVFEDRKPNATNLGQSHPGLYLGEFSPRPIHSDLNMAHQPRKSFPKTKIRTAPLQPDSSDVISQFHQLTIDGKQQHQQNQRTTYTQAGGERVPSLPDPYHYQFKQERGRQYRPNPNFAHPSTSGGSQEETETELHDGHHRVKPDEIMLQRCRHSNLLCNNGLHSGRDEARNASRHMKKAPDYDFEDSSRSMRTVVNDSKGPTMNYASPSFVVPQVLQTVPNGHPGVRGPSYGYGITPTPTVNGTQVSFHETLPSYQTQAAENVTGHGFRSVLLEQFKANSKGYRRLDLEISDIYDHLVEFSGDQTGSRFIQDKLLNATTDERNRVFVEILPNALQLMMDVFGNYVIQRFFERGDQNQKNILVSKMRGQMLNLSNHVYGCRVVQSALHFILLDQQVSLIRELEPNNGVLRCVKDQNGNHVIQAAIEHIPPEHIQFIVEAFIGQVQHLATHAYGCRVVQRLLKYWNEPGRSTILREVHASTTALISDQFGNYVIQYLLDNESFEDRLKIINTVRKDLAGYAKQKFASNVVEKCFTCGTEEQRRDMMLQLSVKDERGETPLTYMIKDAYGNYVLQTLLETLGETNYAIFVNILSPEIARARRFGPNKQAENVAKKMHRLDKKFGCGRMYSNSTLRPTNGHGQGLMPPLSTEIPTPPPTIDGNRTPVSGSTSSSSDGRSSGARLSNMSLNPGPFGCHGSDS